MLRRTFIREAGPAVLLFSLPRPPVRAQTERGLSQTVSELLNKHKVPGLSIALIRDAKIAWSHGFGVQDLTSKVPVTSDSIFEAASLSKPAFAYAVLQMCARGLLKLDTPLTEYLSTPFIPDEPRLKLITARMVLSHTSGLQHGRKEGEPLALLFDPGKRFFYSATGFDYLQKVVEQVTGQSLSEFMKQNVLTPFEMSSSSFGWPAGYENRVAQGYDNKGRSGQTFNERYRLANAERRAAIARLFPELSYPSAAAGMYSTAVDFAKYMIEIIEPTKNANSSHRLPADVLSEMLKPVVKVGDTVSWGVGWGIQHTKLGDAFWHWGNWSGLFHHFAIGLRKEKTGVVIMTNSGNGLKLCRELVPRVMGFDIEPLRGFLS
jgi:CubicO group peptidase (beta-lactamase class C family)